MSPARSRPRASEPVPGRALIPDVRGRAGGALTVRVTGATLLGVPLSPSAELAAGALSDGTLRAYRAAMRGWADWTQSRGVRPLPADPDSICLWLAELAPTHSASALQQRISALVWAHGLHDLPSPATRRVRDALHALQSRSCRPGRGQKDALLLPELRTICAHLPTDRAGARDRAILTLMWAAALRRSEAALLELDNVDLAPEEEREEGGMVVTVTQSKTHLAPRPMAFHHSQGDDHSACPVCAMIDWLAARGTRKGPLFHLSDRRIASMVQKRAAEAGVDGEWGGHSLRAGLVTQAARRGVPVMVIAETTGHRDLAMLMTYARQHGDLFAERNAAVEAGL